MITGLIAKMDSLSNFRRCIIMTHDSTLEPDSSLMRVNASFTLSILSTFGRSFSPEVYFEVS